jgi:hypothetical protein
MTEVILNQPCAVIWLYIFFHDHAMYYLLNTYMCEGKGEEYVCVCIHTHTSDALSHTINHSRPAVINPRKAIL